MGRKRKGEPKLEESLLLRRLDPIALEIALIANRLDDANREVLFTVAKTIEETYLPKSDDTKVIPFQKP